MDGHAAPRLVEEQAAYRVVRPQVLHLREDGLARRRRHAGDDDIPDLTTRMAADDGENRSRGAPPDGRQWIGGRSHALMLGPGGSTRQR
jgi:hypothetical protein